MSDNSPFSNNEINAVQADSVPINDDSGNQNLLLAIVGGILSSMVAAAIWAAITYLTGYRIGLVAIGVGFLVGFAVKLLGNGRTIPFGIVGAFFALVGCVLGNILTAVIAAAFQDQVPVLDIALTFLTNPGVVIDIMKETFSVMDLLFYGIAIYEGFKFSFSDD
jgi:FtsH-binding integral membrane protein